MSMDFSDFPRVFLLVYGVIMAFTLLLGLVFYILSSIGFYTMAKRRGIPHPGLAWLPIGGQSWIIGSLADQYAYHVDGKSKRQRGLLLGLDIGVSSISIGYLAVSILVLVKSLRPDLVYEDSALVPFIVSFLVFYVLLLVSAIVYAVFYYIALHRVYKSCKPSNATLYLVLSIVLSVTQPFFIFFNRNKDEGMSPMQPAGDGPQQVEAGEPNPAQ